MEKFRDSCCYKENKWEAVLKDGKYVLKDDFDKDKVNEEISQEYQFQIPPGPFLGDPDAAIWVLLANPGFAENIEKNCYGDDIAYLRDCGDQKIDCKRENRLAACKAQLEFKKTGDYYNFVLNDEFRRKRLFAGTKWFLDRFVGNNKLLFDEKEDNHTIDRRFFLLQVHGYHSENFDESCFKKTFPHMTKNKLLLEWGIMAGKVIVIARRHEYWHNIINKLNHDDSRIFVMPYPRSVYFTKNNLVGYKDWKKSKEIKEGAQKEAQEILTKAKKEAEEIIIKAKSGIENEFNEVYRENLT